MVLDYCYHRMGIGRRSQRVPLEIAKKFVVIKNLRNIDPSFDFREVYEL